MTKNTKEETKQNKKPSDVTEQFRYDVSPPRALYDTDPNNQTKDFPIQTNVVSEESDSELDTVSSNEVSKVLPSKNEVSYAKGQRSAAAEDEYVKVFEDGNDLMHGSDSDFGPMVDSKFKEYKPDDNNGTEISDIFNIKNVLPLVETKKGTINVKNTGLLNPTAHIGIDTIGNSRKYANYDLRAAPPNPRVQVGPFLQSTVGPDDNIVPLC
jgi:hypothetical protein